MNPAARLRRLAIGLGLALALALWGEHWVLSRTRAAAGALAAEQTAVVELVAVEQLVSLAGGRGEPVRRAVDRYAAGDSVLATLKVIAFDGLSLEASTAPEDEGEAAAPRRLQREEKPLYDQGQRLRAAVETNRQEGVFRKDEIEVAAEEAGGLALAAPVATDGEITGAVLATTEPLPPPAGAGALPPLLLFAAALALFLVGAPLLPGRWLPTGLALVLLAVAVAGYAAWGFATVRSDRRAAEEAVAARLATTRDRVRAVAAELDLPAAALDATTWDVDRYRRPRGLVTAAGEVEAAAFATVLAGARRQLHRFALFLFAAGAVVLLVVGLGGLAWLWRAVAANRVAYAYIVPAMVSMLVLVFFPFFYGIFMSFTEANLYNVEKFGEAPLDFWVGLDNYASILSDFAVFKDTEQGRAVNFENFYYTLLFTIAWTVTNVAWGVTIGLILALLLNTAGLRLRPAYRVLLILPWALPNYITALIWKGMFHQQLGIINQVVQMLGLAPVAWFEAPFTSFLAIWATNGWLSFPFMMVISLGALQSIPGDLYEAARVDGASRWQQFRSITLPSLKPALVPAVIISVIWTFNMFNIPYLTSAGEPAHATEILITQGYKIAFEKYQYGYAAAYATIIFFILLVYGTWQNRVTRAAEGI